MSIFKDSKFEQLDYLSQITETIHCSINEILAELPDEIAISYDDLTSFMRGSLYWNNPPYKISGKSGDFIRIFVQDVILRKGYDNLTYNGTNLLYECFELVISDGAHLDLNSKELFGSVKLVKTRKVIEDHELQSIFAKDASYEFNFLSRSDVPGILQRMNDVLSILDKTPKAIFRSTSFRNKKITIKLRTTHIIKSNEWRVRSHDLIIKMTRWIIFYIENADMKAFTNLAKLKAMTYNNGPIYSMEEE